MVRIGVYEIDPLLMLRQRFKTDAEVVLNLCSGLKGLVLNSIEVLRMADECTYDRWHSYEEEIYRIFQELYKMSDILNKMSGEFENLWHQMWDLSEEETDLQQVSTIKSTYDYVPYNPKTKYYYLFTDFNAVILYYEHCWYRRDRINHKWIENIDWERRFYDAGYDVMEIEYDEKNERIITPVKDKDENNRGE